MTDHEHEWRIRQSKAPAGGVVIYCIERGCNLELIVEQAEAILNEHVALEADNAKLTAWQQLTVGSLLFWLEGEIGLDFATHAKRLLRDVCTCENKLPLCRICKVLADTQESR